MFPTLSGHLTMDFRFGIPVCEPDESSPIYAVDAPAGVHPTHMMEIWSDGDCCVSSLVG